MLPSPHRLKLTTGIYPRHRPIFWSPWRPRAAGPVFHSSPVEVKLFPGLTLPFQSLLQLGSAKLMSRQKIAARFYRIPLRSSAPGQVRPKGIKSCQYSSFLYTNKLDSRMRWNEAGVVVDYNKCRRYAYVHCLLGSSYAHVQLQLQRGNFNFSFNYTKMNNVDWTGL